MRTTDTLAPTTRRTLRTDVRRRRRRRRTGLVAAVLTAVAGIGPATATTGDLVVDAPVTPGRGVGVLATIEDAEAWCSSLSDYYLRFTSPWAARVINCRRNDIFVQPLYHDGTTSLCVLVPARHSRHLGGSITHRVVDVRLC